MRPIFRILAAAVVVPSLCSCFNPSGSSWIKSGPAPEDLVTIKRSGRDVIVTGCSIFSLRNTNGDGMLQEYVVGKSDRFDTIFPKPNTHPIDFCPSGICKTVENGKEVIYVNNKARKAVEVFEVTAAGDLDYQPDFLPTNDLLEKGNGIAAFPDGTVYVTDFGFFSPKGGDAPRVPDVLPKNLENSIIGYVPSKDGRKKWQVVMTGFAGCNGIAPGPDGRSLLVNSLHSKTIWNIRRDPKTGALSNPVPLGLPLDFHPDNLKKTGPTHYEASGQISKMGVFLNLAFTWPVSPGGAVAFDWDGKHLTNIESRTHLVRANRYSPSTTIKVGPYLYSGQPRCEGVFRTPAN